MTTRLEHANICVRDVDGMILWQPNFQFVWSPNNFDVRRSGIDVAFRATHRPSQIALHGSYSLTDIRYTGPVLTGQVVYRPRHSGSVGVSAPWRQIRADAAARYVGERRTVAGSPLNALPGYWMVDLGASVRLPLGAWHGDAFLRIENLFDTRAALLADYPLPSRAVRVGFGVDH